jgi:hypothetical protein
VAADVAGDFTAARGEADQDCVLASDLVTASTAALVAL